jgi:hypothetical protein
MEKALFIICIASALVGCTGQAVSHPHIETGLILEFESEFDRLFLSQEPLRYQDNVQFLSSIQKAKLNPEEMELVRAKLKEFLSTEPEPRPYAPDSIHTGVASEISFLRLQAVQILGEIGTKGDAAFIRNLDIRTDEHPLFDGECEETIKQLETR